MGKKELGLNTKSSCCVGSGREEVSQLKFNITLRIVSVLSGLTQLCLSMHKIELEITISIRILWDREGLLSMMATWLIWN